MRGHSLLGVGRPLAGDSEINPMDVPLLRTTPWM